MIQYTWWKLKYLGGFIRADNLSLSQKNLLKIKIETYSLDYKTLIVFLIIIFFSIIKF